MNTQQNTETSRILPIRFNRWSALITAMLLGATMVLSACGAGEAEPVAVPTEVATMAAPEATEATEAETTPEVSESEGVTETEEVDDSETTTDTEGVDDSEAVTDTEGVDDSEAMTDTEGVTETEGVTDTEGMDDSETMTDTEGVDDSEAVTDTEGVDDSETMTDTEGVDDSEAVTETGAADGAESAALMGVGGVDAQQYVRASTLLDYDFENLDGEVSGDLEDLLINLDTGRVLFAAIEYGGVLDLGDKDIVIPLNAFTTGPEGQLVLNIDEASLENYPDVGNDWPDLNDPVWDDDVNAYWTEAGIDVGTGFDEPATNAAWASDLMGYNIADLGFGAGSILDILVNLGTGHAPYFIVDYGEGLDTDPYIIPVAAYDLTDWSAEFVYGPDFTPDILENAPRFDQEAYPEGSALDLEFGDRLESAWNDLGFSNDVNNDGEID
jgi:sporulation protein YlmC with PRC-barrel domain